VFYLLNNDTILWCKYYIFIGIPTTPVTEPKTGKPFDPLGLSSYNGIKK
jgi:hypothetical protein